MQEDKKPGWGATIGAFFLCGCLAIGTCIIVSAAMASNMGYSGYSNGGLLGTLTGVGCAAYYRSTGKMGTAAIAAIIIGAVLGFVAVQMALSYAGGR